MTILRAVCCTLGSCIYDHTFSGRTYAGGNQISLALYLNHADTTVSITAIPNLIFVAEMWDYKTLAFGNFPNRLTRRCGNLMPVKLERNCVSH
jgi:hypothetical protein